MSTVRIFVGHLARRTQDRDIQELFERYGRVENVRMKEGYAFVEMPDPRAAAEAIAELDGREFDGSQIGVETAKGEKGGEEKLRDRTNFRVVLEDLPETCRWQELKDFGRQAGRVLFADVKIQDGRKAGIIEFATEEAMLYAIRKLDGSRICGTPIRISREEPDGRAEAARPPASARRTRSPDRDQRPTRRRERSRSRDERRREPSPDYSRDHHHHHRDHDERRHPARRSFDRELRYRSARYDEYGYDERDRYLLAARRNPRDRWEYDDRAGSGRRRW